MKCLATEYVVDLVGGFGTCRIDCVVCFEADSILFSDGNAISSSGRIEKKNIKTISMFVILSKHYRNVILLEFIRGAMM